MARGWDRGRAGWKLGDSEGFNLHASCWDLITPFSAPGSLLILVQEGLVGAVVVPSGTPEPGSAVSGGKRDTLISSALNSPQLCGLGVQLRLCEVPLPAQGGDSSFLCAKRCVGWRWGEVVQRTIWLKDPSRKACENKAGLAFLFHLFLSHS